MSFLSLVNPMRAWHEQLLTDRCTIVRQGVPFKADVACRTHKDRLFSEPGDPQDANVRSMQEWGITLLTGTGSRIGDTITFTDKSIDAPISIIVGEVLSGDTWQIMERAWGTEPKISTPEITVTLWRYDPFTDDWAEIDPPVTGNIVYDRTSPEATPIRYSPAGQALYKDGTFIVPLGTDIRNGDRFTIEGLSAVIWQILPGQPQHIEAKFRLDISGDRGG